MSSNATTKDAVKESNGAAMSGGTPSGDATRPASPSANEEVLPPTPSSREAASPASSTTMSPSSTAAVHDLRAAINATPTVTRNIAAVNNMPWSPHSIINESTEPSDPSVYSGNVYTSSGGSANDSRSTVKTTSAKEVNEEPEEDNAASIPFDDTSEADNTTDTNISRSGEDRVNNTSPAQLHQQEANITAGTVSHDHEDFGRMVAGSAVLGHGSATVQNAETNALNRYMAAYQSEDESEAGSVRNEPMEVDLSSDSSPRKRVSFSDRDAQLPEKRPRRQILKARRPLRRPSTPSTNHDSDDDFDAAPSVSEEEYELFITPPPSREASPVSSEAAVVPPPDANFCNSCGRGCGCPRMPIPLPAPEIPAPELEDPEPEHDIPAPELPAPAPEVPAPAPQPAAPAAPRPRRPRKKQSDPEFGRLQDIKDLKGASLPAPPPVVARTKNGRLYTKQEAALGAEKQVKVVESNGFEAGNGFQAALYLPGIVALLGRIPGAPRGSALLRDAEKQVQILYHNPEDPIVELAAGSSHILMRSEAGHLFAVGRSQEGQLGIENPGRYRQAKVTPETMRRVVKDANGKDVEFASLEVEGNHNLAMAKNGDIYQCGQLDGEPKIDKFTLVVQD